MLFSALNKVDLSIVVYLFFILCPMAFGVNAFKFSFSGTLATDLQPLMHVRQPVGSEKVAWIGADCATSLLLNCDEGNVQYLWLWGDTLLGNITKEKTRVIKYFVHNTVSVMNIPENRSVTPDDVSFCWGVNSSTGEPNALFNSLEHSEMYYWPISGVHVDNLLVIAAYRIQPNKSEPLGFETNETTFLAIPNSQCEPSEWNFTEYHVPSTGKDVNFCSSVTVDPMNESIVYVVGSYDNSAVLARYFRQDLLDHNWPEMEVWAHDSKGKLDWVQWPVDPSSLEKLGQGAPEGSLVYNSFMNLWYTILLDFNDTKFYIAIAEDPRGPWKKLPTPIYTVAPPYNDRSKYFCYAPKSHPELAVVEEEIIMSYNCNSFDFFHIAASDLNFYTPQMVRIDIKKSGA